MMKTLHDTPPRAPLNSLIHLAAMCGLVALGPACKSAEGKGDAGETVKEKPSNTREFTEEELATFLKTRNFDVYGGELSSQYIDLDGVAPRELLVEVRCAQQSCYGDFYKIQGSNYFLYSLADSLESPQMLTPRPISLGPDAQAQMADIDGDKQADLLLSGQGRDGTRNLKIYSVLGKLLSARFEGSLPYGSISQLVLDLDEDGSMEIVTLQQQDNATQPGNAYNYGYGYGPMVQPNLLDALSVQTWQVSRGSLNLKSVNSQSGLTKAFEAMRSSPETPIMELARGMLLMRHYNKDIENPGPLLDRLMARYEKLRKEGQQFKLTAQNQDPYAYPQYDAYGNPITPDEFASTPSYDMYILLAALKQPGQPQVAKWSKDYITHASTLDELSAQLELTLETTPESERGKLSSTLLDNAFDVLLNDGPNSPNFYNLAYFDPSYQEMEPVQRQFFIASFLLDPSFEFKGREQSIKRFLDRSTKNPMAMQTLLPQYPLAQAIAPYLIEMDLGAMPSDFVSIMLNQILPTYISTLQSEGSTIAKEKKEKLAASLKSFMTKHPDRRNEVLYFVSNYFQDPAFGPIVADMMSRLRKTFESGRATQQDRDNLYNVSMLLPLAMDELSTGDRKWWINYVYRQGMGYNLDSKLAEGCYNLSAQSDEQIETILTSMESLPKESTLASMCLPYMLGIYDGASPLKDEHKERLPGIIDARLTPGGDEYQLQQFLMTLENYEKIAEFAPSLWRVVKKRKGAADTARYQALVMLAKMGEKGAMTQLEKTSKKLFTDSKFRDKNPYFNDYFYVDLLARQHGSLDILELMFTLAEDKKIIPNSCVLLRDYMQSYGRTAEFDEKQQTRWEKLCTGTTASLGGGGGGVVGGVIGGIKEEIPIPY